MKIKRIFQYNFFKKISTLLYVVSFFTWSCNISKHVPEGDFLIKNVEINFGKNSLDSIHKTLDKELVYDLIKQKPNRKVFSKLRLYLSLYNFSNQKRINSRVIVKQRKVDLINSKIEYKNNKRLSKDSSFKIKVLKERALTFGEKIQRAGESPVILNQILTNATKTQISNYLYRFKKRREI